MNAPQIAQEASDLSRFYWLVGAMIVMNFGQILAFAGAAFRGVWWLAKLEARVASTEKDVNAAHARLRDIEKGKIINVEKEA